MSIERIVELANLQLAIQADVDQLEKQLKARKADLEKVSKIDLPELMIELGVSELTLSSGQKVELKNDFYAKIPDDKYPIAFDWLKEHGFAGIIKSNVVAAFGVGEEQKAEELYENLQSHHVAVSLDQKIHPQTLKAFVRERMEKADIIPFDVFGIVPFNKVVIS